MFLFHSVDPVNRTNELPPRGYSSPSNQHPQHRFPSPHQLPGRLTKPPQSSFSPTPRQPGFLQPNIYPQQRFSKQSSPQQINMMPSPQQMKHYSGSYRSQERFYIPSQSPRKRFNSPSFGPRSSPNLLPRDPTSNHDIRARFPPSSSSGSMSLVIFLKSIIPNFQDSSLQIPLLLGLSKVHLICQAITRPGKSHLPSLILHLEKMLLSQVEIIVRPSIPSKL